MRIIHPLALTCLALGGHSPLSRPAERIHIKIQIAGTGTSMFDGHRTTFLVATRRIRGPSVLGEYPPAGR